VTEQRVGYGAPPEPPSMRPLHGKASADAPERELTFGTLLVIVMRNVRLVAIAMVVAVVITVIMQIRVPTSYSASASFVPVGGGSSSASSLAAQLGFGGGGSDALGSPAFYAELITHKAILESIVDTVGNVRRPDGRMVPLADALGKTGSDQEKREAAAGAIRKMISISIAGRTQVITITTQAPDPEIAYRLAEGTIAALTHFNSVVRQTSAASERRFIERRRAEVRSELTVVEERLKDFLRRNRGGLDSPEFDFERQRLMTEVNLRRDLYSQLSLGYERARMDEVRDTPVITVIQPPIRPRGPNATSSLRGLVLAAIGGGLVGLVLAFLLESFKFARQHYLGAEAA
jgi:tyrosine-protein kinase Etk/Wzc